MPDASLIAAFVFGEDKAAEAASRLGSARLCAPGLWRYELANIAWRKDPRERDAVFLGLALAMSLLIEDLEPDHAEVLELAIVHELSAYDASLSAKNTPVIQRPSDRAGGRRISADAETLRREGQTAAALRDDWWFLRS